VLEPLALKVIQRADSACSILQSQHTREETLLKRFACYVPPSFLMRLLRILLRVVAISAALVPNLDTILRHLRQQREK
jgi:hypothetical protein